MSLGLIDIKIFQSKVLKVFVNILISINPKNIKLLPFDTSQWDESNNISYIFLWSLDAEIFGFKALNVKYFKFTSRALNLKKFNITRVKFNVKSVKFKNLIFILLNIIEHFISF